MRNKILDSNVFKRGYGTISELLEEISKDDLRYLQLGGYIKIGISNEGETFSITKKGKKILYFYSDDISLMHKIQSLLFNI